MTITDTLTAEFEAAIAVRTGHNNNDLPVGAYYIHHDRAVRSSSYDGVQNYGIGVALMRRAVEFDEVVASRWLPASSQYEPETLNKAGRFGAYRDVVVPERINEAISWVRAQRPAASS